VGEIFLRLTVYTGRTSRSLPVCASLGAVGYFEKDVVFEPRGVPAVWEG